MLEHSGSALLFLIAGIGVFLLFLNRVAIHYKDSLPKTGVVLSFGAVLTIGAARVGSRIGFSVWLGVPLVILAGIFVGELRRALIRRRTRGSAPIAHHKTPLSLIRPFTHTDLNVTRYEIQHPCWQVEQFRIAHLSDLHVSDRYPDSFYRKVRRHLDDAAPDLLVITGDFVSTVKDIPLLTDTLTLLTDGFAAVAVLGNHDYWAGAQHVAETVQAAGVDVLRHTCRDGSGYVLCGDEGHWGEMNDQIAAVAREHFTIVLTHTPDNIYRLSDAGAHLVFAGHYHAGQFRLPYLGSLIVPSVYGRRFDHGHFVISKTHLFVTSGLGVAVLPFRLYCQPDIFIVDVMAG